MDCLRHRNGAVMPRRCLLSTECCLFATPVDHAEMAKHYVLRVDNLALALACSFGQLVQQSHFFRFSGRLRLDVA